MKASAHNPTILIAVAAMAVLAAPLASNAAPVCAAMAGAASAQVSAPDAPLAYPSFCSIPPAPKDVRAATAYKAAVVEVRLAGARLMRQTTPDTFTLTGTDGFLDHAREEAAPPPPFPPLGGLDTDAFVKAMRQRATPPPRPH